MAYGNVNNLKAVFTYTILDRVLCLVDLVLAAPTAMSITNDAEAVVHWCFKELDGLGFNKIIYQDTDGIWDELVTDGSEFVRFKAIGERDITTAVQKVRNEST